MKAQSGEIQSQVITSADGRLRTLHHRMFPNRFGHRTVEGVLRNVGRDANVTAEVKVEFYSADGSLIGIEADKVRLLETGQTGVFEVVYSGDRRWEIQYYKITCLSLI